MEKIAGYMNKDVLVEREGRLIVVTLNRPEHGNALTGPPHDEFVLAIEKVARETDVRCVIITGAGNYFLSRLDNIYEAIKAGIESPNRLKDSYRIATYARQLVEALLSVEAPIVAAINGDAIGLGSTIALTCDIQVMDERAKIGDKHLRYGVVAGDGGQILYPLLIGPNRAKDFLIRGLLVDGKEAERIGLVNYVTPPGQAFAKAREIAEDIMTKPPLAVKWTKAAVNQQIQMLFALNLRLGLATEVLTFLSDDHVEAVTSILDQRDPDFSGT